MSPATAAAVAAAAFGATPAMAAPIAEALEVSKSFGASLALDAVTMAVPAGDSRALVGRNGAGKSTLVGILTGLLEPDGGQVSLGGEPSPGLALRSWWRRRVACVYQRSTVIPTLTVAENLFINAQPVAGAGWIDWPGLRRRAREVLDEWDLDVDVDVDAALLGVEQRQIVEIARALLAGTRFIILDEPTAQLEAREVTRLFDRITRLQAAGVTFLYISHHLEEIYAICRSVTVLRDGRVVADAPLTEMPKERVVAAMVGEEVRAPRAQRAQRSAAPARSCLEVADLRVGTAVGGVSFAVAAGECVGLAGLAGSGKEEVGEAIAGLVRPQAGAIRLGGTPLPAGEVAAARRAGVGYVPRDRHRRGIVPQLGLDENLTLTIVERLGRAGWISLARRERVAAGMIRELQIKAAAPAQPIGELSGGNQQKALMGRALASQPRLLVISHPTQGVDIASKAALFAIVDEARAAGTGVLLVSDDLDELTVCDRVLVIFKGRLTAEFAAGCSDHDLVAAIEGVGHGG